MSSPPKKQFETRSPYTGHLGIEVLEAEAGRSVCRMNFTEHLRNRRGLVHGGAIFSLVDSAMGVAQFYTLKPGENGATLEVQIGFLRPVIDESMKCEARVIKRGSRVIFLEAEVKVGEELVATATGSYAVSSST